MLENFMTIQDQSYRTLQELRRMEEYDRALYDLEHVIDKLREEVELKEIT